MTDFRALCEELLTDYEQNRFRVELAAEARAALAEQPVGGTDEELDELWDEEAGYFALYAEAKRFGRAVLARWGTPANNTREEN
jgi:hypothetical protein